MGIGTASKKRGTIEGAVPKPKKKPKHTKGNGAARGAGGAVQGPRGKATDEKKIAPEGEERKDAPKRSEIVERCCMLCGVRVELHETCCTEHPDAPLLHFPMPADAYERMSPHRVDCFPMPADANRYPAGSVHAALAQLTQAHHALLSAISKRRLHFYEEADLFRGVLMTDENFLKLLKTNPRFKSYIQAGIAEKRWLDLCWDAAFVIQTALSTACKKVPSRHAAKQLVRLHAIARGAAEPSDTVPSEMCNFTDYVDYRMRSIEHYLRRAGVSPDHAIHEIRAKAVSPEIIASRDAYDDDSRPEDEQHVEAIAFAAQRISERFEEYTGAYISYFAIVEIVLLAVKKPRWTSLGIAADIVYTATRGGHVVWKLGKAYSRTAIVKKLDNAMRRRTNGVNASLESWEEWWAGKRTHLDPA